MGKETHTELWQAIIKIRGQGCRGGASSVEVSKKNRMRDEKKKRERVSLTRDTQTHQLDTQLSGGASRPINRGKGEKIMPITFGRVGRNLMEGNRAKVCSA